MRLDKFLVHMGFGSRKEVKNLVKAKLITVNGTVVKNSDMKIDENKDQVAYNDEIIHYQEYFYLMMNKPAGYISATEDRYDHTVLDLIEGYDHVDLFPVGRLDKDTEGLLILSNNGEMAHYILSPKHHVDKEYYVETRDPLTDDLIGVFSKPMDLGDFTTMEAKLTILDERKAKIIIHEGKFHQVKRMFEHVGNEVTYLKRLRMQNVVLDESLKLGEYREMSQEEINQLKGEEYENSMVRACLF